MGEPDAVPKIIHQILAFFADGPLASGIEVRAHEPHQSLQRRLNGTGRFDPARLSEIFAGCERLRYRQHGRQGDARALRLLRREIKGLKVARSKTAKIVRTCRTSG